MTNVQCDLNPFYSTADLFNSLLDNLANVIQEFLGRYARHGSNRRGSRVINPLYLFCSLVA